jgi:outer membrane receptor protein involved in Fe transport
MFCPGSIRVAVGEELEEITVTAQKREQSSQDVPLTISTLSGAEMSKANIRDLFQIADHVPGMVFSRLVKNVNNSLSEDFASPSVDPRFAGLASPAPLRTAWLTATVHF